MKPADFSNFVKEICEKCGYDFSRIFLGGDHLGPLTWTHLPEAEAMKKYLLSQGINKKNILIEDKSKNTKENIKFSFSSSF